MTESVQAVVDAVIAEILRVEDEVAATTLAGLAAERDEAEAALQDLEEEQPYDRALVEAGLRRRLQLIRENEDLVLSSHRERDRTLRTWHAAIGPAA
jgi:cell division protein FtsB